MVAITVKKVSDVKFFNSREVLWRNKIQKLAGANFDLPASGLWSQHLSTAPSRSDAYYPMSFVLQLYVL